MPFDSGFLDLMASIVTYEPWLAYDVYGTSSFGPVYSFPAHVTYSRKITRDDSGEEAVSTAQIQIPPAGYVWLNGDYPITIPVVAVYDRFVLPLDNVERKVLNATRYTDEETSAVGYSFGLPFAEHHQSIDLT